MLKNHEQSWSGEFVEINFTENAHWFDTGQKFIQVPTVLRGTEETQARERRNRQAIKGRSSSRQRQNGPPGTLDTKNDGKHRFCIYYRIHNSMNVKDTYPLPRIMILSIHLVKQNTSKRLTSIWYFCRWKYGKSIDIIPRLSAMREHSNA